MRFKVFGLMAMCRGRQGCTGGQRELGVPLAAPVCFSDGDWKVLCRFIAGLGCHSGELQRLAGQGTPSEWALPCKLGGAAFASSKGLSIGS